MNRLRSTSLKKADRGWDSKSSILEDGNECVDDVLRQTRRDIRHSTYTGTSRPKHFRRDVIRAGEEFVLASNTPS